MLFIVTIKKLSISHILHHDKIRTNRSHEQGLPMLKAALTLHLEIHTMSDGSPRLGSQAMALAADSPGVGAFGPAWNRWKRGHDTTGIQVDSSVGK